MNDRGKAFALGIFIVGAIFIIAWFVLFLRPRLGDGKTTMHVLFTNIDKITIGTRVTYAGKPLGEVYRIRENPKAREQPPDAQGNLYTFELILKVDSSVHVYTYDHIGFSTSGLLGEKTIEITPRGTPEGSSPPCEITGDLLLGESTSRIDQALSNVIEVTENVKVFINNNDERFQLALDAFERASEQLALFAGQANDCEVALKTASAMEKADIFFSNFGDSGRCFNEIMCRLSNEDGSLGQWMFGDCLFTRFNTVMSQLEILLHDMNRYGILYQFSGKWQREKRAREKCIIIEK